MKMGSFRSRIDPKPPLNGKSGRENLQRKLGPTCWRGRGPNLRKYFTILGLP